jgi:solute carrier family 25 (peroxisomal adenine nucleotide transporter), member 17
MIAGAVAGSATVLITNPIWVINTRMTARTSESTSALPSVSPTSKPPRKPSTISTVLSLLREEGATALFAGVLPALVLVINPILQYTIFEQLKDALEKHRGKVLSRDAFFLGAIGKLLATSITYPYITVKSRMHVARREGPQDNIIGSLKRIVREEGWAGLYKGMFGSFNSDLYQIPDHAIAYQYLRTGIGPKVTQSVITAAFLFAFKDALYAASVQARNRVPRALPLK